MARDSLRAALDDLQLDEQSAKDRPYIEAMLRRLGYTETEIRAELAPVRPASHAEPAPVETAQDFSLGGAPARQREYRLVVPARESAFSYADAHAFGPRRDSPFESFERVVEETVADDDLLEFAPMEDDLVEFEEVGEGLAAGEAHEPFSAAPAEEFEADAGVEFEALPSDESEAPGEEFEAVPEEAFETVSEEPFEAMPVQEFQSQAAEAPLDTFVGADVDPAPRTRVRMKRVRAKSRAEAEAKVASQNRRVIKSIPVDIVERWGSRDAAGNDGKGSER